jgi:hypothetical protein
MSNLRRLLTFMISRKAMMATLTPVRAHMMMISCVTRLMAAN